MKKTFTFLAAAILMAAAAIAQNNNHQNNNEYNDEYGSNNPRNVPMDNDNDWRKRNKGKKAYYLALRERDIQIAQISREYNNRIQSVRNNFFMGRYKKERIINTLQFQRDEEIRLVIARFNHRENHYSKNNRWYQDRDNRNWE
jgi:hypothetical protein